MTLFPKQNIFVLFFYWTVSEIYSVDSLRSVLWLASEKYCGQSPIRTLVSLREVLWTISDTYFGQSPRSTVDNLRYVLWSISKKYCGQSPKIICILDVPSNPKHKVDHFRALTPLSCDAPCINANASVIACHFMLHVRYASHATYKSHITYQVPWINYV